MSGFFSEKFKNLTPYTPGEQPKDMKYIKLNTNESPFAPDSNVVTAVTSAVSSVNFYPDQDCKNLINNQIHIR